MPAATIPTKTIQARGAINTTSWYRIPRDKKFVSDCEQRGAVSLTSLLRYLVTSLLL
jgi:hypothetical protein